MTTAPSPRHAQTPSEEQTNAEILLWQSRIRIGFALLVATVGIALTLTDALAGVPAAGVASFVGYVAITAGIAAVVRRRMTAPRWTVVVTVASDILFVFGITYVSTPPLYYERSLLLGFAVLGFTEFYFGPSYAWGGLVAIVAGYVALIWPATGPGRTLAWPQELWSLVLFGLAGATFIVHYGSFKRRLATIIQLFDRAEEGDFSGEYDLSADPRPDGVTMVGRAYNRVRAQLANLVLTDPLSGCLNRRGLEQQLTRELSRAARNGKEIALLAIDVDHFKIINDTLGHIAGDAVIQEVGELLREVARGGDLVARTGGDEFTLLLPDTSAAGAFRLATRIREAVNRRQFQGLSTRMPVSVSIGLVAEKVSDENIAHDLHSRADEALYAAKDGGRNRVAIWTANLRAIAVSRASQQVMADR